MKSRIAVAILGAVLLARTLSAAGEQGQVTFATAPVPGATVTASQGDKHVVTTTDIQGVYRFPDLPDGAWTIDVEMLGFEKVSQAVTVAADAAPANVELKILPFESVSGTVKPSANTRAFTTGAAPQPNANRPNTPNAQNRPAAPAAGGAPAAPPPSGNAGSDINADGLVVNGSVNNGAASPFAQLAAFGNSRRGGRSLYNWSLGLFLGSSALDARQFSFGGGTPPPKPSYTDAQMNGTFGGPIKIPGLQNRVTLTLSYQHIADHNVTTQSGLVPTALEREGDFSQSLDASGNTIRLINPVTGLPFSGDKIPGGSISPQAAALLNYYPMPNVDNGTFNYQAPVLVTTRQDQFQTRFNDAINNKNSVFGNFNVSRGVTDSGNIFSFTDTSRVTSIDAAVNWSRRFSLFTTLRAGYHFTDTITSTTPYFADSVNVSGLAGINGNDQTPDNWGPPGLAFSRGIAGLSSTQFQDNHDFANALTAEATWSHNRHNFTYGGGVSLRHLNVFSQQNARGNLTFTGAATGSDFGDFLLGIPSASSIAFGNPDKYLTAPTWNAYVTDDWRLTPTFTANVGLRWEYEAPMSERDGRLVNLDIANGFTAVAPVLASNPTGSLTGTQYAKSLVNPDRRGVQPRLAIAWRPIPGSSLVVRAGYGIYRNAQVFQSVAMLLAQQPPLSTTATVANTPISPLTLANPFAAAGAGANTFAVDPNLRVGYAQNWQVSVQRDLPASLTMNLTYLGTKGSDLMQEYLPNTYPTGAVNPCPTCPSGFIYLASNGHSMRNSGQFQIRRRLRNGFTASVLYTLAKATDDATAFAGASLAGSSIAQNWQDLNAEEGPSSFDQRHQVQTSLQYSTGQGIGGGALMTGWKGALFKGWTFTSQWTVGSGMPFTPIILTTVPGTGVTGTIRPSYTGESTAPQTGGYYLNPSAYAAPAAGQWGNVGRNSARGPSQFSLDGSAGRSFILGQRLTLDWQFRATNLLNRQVFTAVNPQVGSATFGQATQLNQARKLQMVARLRF
ncbi:MAG TPA: carboxypeptidase regulatory-like domain-containing protein [Vicinamibacterales bacterium]|nr:carboxypeptidase regulatory-like domain-containing protein [Vicinamibacterales bacterium]